MVKPSTPPSPPSFATSSNKFKGVRRRSWGRWVSEIRIPHSRDKIWLGSYSTPEQAARAYDAAVVLLRGPSSSSLNFPLSPRHAPPPGSLLASPRTVQASAAAAASLVSPPTPPMDADQSSAGDDPLPPPEESTSNAPRPLSAQVTPAHELSAPFDEVSWMQELINSLQSPRGNSSMPHPLPKPTEEQRMFDDFQPFETTLAGDGFTATSGSVTISERFDIDSGLCTDSRLWIP